MFTELLSAFNSEQAHSLLAMAIGIYFLAGIIKGTLGIGFPTAAVSLLAQVTDARTAITLVIMPMLITNIWQVIRSKQFWSVIQQIWLLLVLMLVFIGIFSQLASLIRVDILAAVLGVIVAVYALHSLYSPPLLLKPNWDKRAQVVAGISAGLMGGMVSVWAPPILIYLKARGFKKEQFVATVGVILLLGSCVLLLSYVGTGTLSYGVFLSSMLLVVPSMLGFTVGEQIRMRLSVGRFERLLLWFFFIMGLNLIRRALF